VTGNTTKEDRTGEPFLSSLVVLPLALIEIMFTGYDIMEGAEKLPE
jgi:hypothetical protein